VPDDWELPEAEDEEEPEEEFGPDSADWDLSEEHGYLWYPSREHWPVAPWVLAVVSVIAAVSLIVPTLVIIFWR
jgi:hypothetical protein